MEVSESQHFQALFKMNLEPVPEEPFIMLRKNIITFFADDIVVTCRKRCRQEANHIVSKLKADIRLKNLDELNNSLE